MRPSLLNMRRHLRPLVWLLLAVIVPALSPHFVENMVLCIGEGHIAVESAQAAHHDGGAVPLSPAGEEPEMNEVLASVSAVPVLEASVSETLVLRHLQRRVSDEAPCQDVPLYLAHTAYACHQAVQTSTLDVESVAVSLLVTVLDWGIVACDRYPVVSSDEVFTTPTRLLSTVVLLI